MYLKFLHIPFWRRIQGTGKYDESSREHAQRDGRKNAVGKQSVLQRHQDLQE